MKIASIICCEDIRREVDNRASAMGIYTDIHLTSRDGKEPIFPATLRLAFVIRIEKNDTDEIPTHYTVKILLNEKKISEISGSIEEFKSRYLNIMVLNPLFRIPESGSLSIEVLMQKQNNFIYSEKAVDIVRIQ